MVLDGAAVAAFGLAATVAGIGLTVAAQFSMGDSWRIGVDTEAQVELVTGGVFGLVRNPIFTAMVVAGSGLAL